LQVADGAAERCRQARREFVRGRVRAAIEEARASAMDLEEIEAILRDEWAKAKAQGNGKANGQEEGGARSQSR
jgi:hypothetical protein